MRDAEIRAALVAHLRRSHPNPREDWIWPEMTVGLGASRIDVGLVNGSISGYEIKSPRDSLRRLPGQVENYSRCLDRATIIVGEARAKTIAEHVPSWWGVAVAHSVDGEIEFRWERLARDNPKIDPFAVAQLLWREEAYAELCEQGVANGLKRATRWQLWDALAELPLEQLRASVRRRLKKRLAAAGGDERTLDGGT